MNLLHLLFLNTTFHYYTHYLSILYSFLLNKHYYTHYFPPLSIKILIDPTTLLTFQLNLLSFTTFFLIYVKIKYKTEGVINICSAQRWLDSPLLFRLLTREKLWEHIVNCTPSVRSNYILPPSHPFLYTFFFEMSHPILYISKLTKNS